MAPHRRCFMLFIIFVVLQEITKAPVIQAWNFIETRSVIYLITKTKIKAGSSTTSNHSDVPFQRVGTDSPSRRQLLMLSLLQPILAGSTGFFLVIHPSLAFARNLPISTGADTSRVGTKSTLLPMVTLRTNIALIQQTIKEQGRNEKLLLNAITKTKTILLLKTSKNTDINDSFIAITTREEDFKRIFDAYSDTISYKQKFLDQNAFLVYYTNGYDGPGRDKLEKDPVNERQTLQFGARNEAWISWENFLSEFDYYYSLPTISRSTSNEYQESIDDMMKYLTATILAVDRYLKLAPIEDVKAVQEINSLKSND